MAHDDGFPTTFCAPASHGALGPAFQHTPESRSRKAAKTTMKAIWNGVVIAQSDDTVVVEGNHYFPAASLKREYVLSSNHRSTCPWKGMANYYSLLVNGDLNPEAVWYYPEPSEAAAQIKDRVAFWKGVQVTE